jgi:hypothetical protein
VELMRRLALAFVVVLLLALAWAGRGAAAYQDPRINAVASSVSGKPITASCAADSREWAQFQTTAGFKTEQDGFTFVGQAPIIYLAPRVCQTLMALLGAPRFDVGPYWAALAIKVLIHESVHQRGITDEGITDCTALPLVPTYAVSSFGYPAKVTKYVYTKTKLGTFKRAKKTVPNPELAKLAYWALQWHRAQPANYQGGC